MSREEELAELYTVEALLVGEKFKHFTGGIYVVDGAAIHTETGEIMIIYHNINREHSYEFHACPKDMFLSKVDREERSDTTQEYRFERVVDCTSSSISH